MKALLKIFLVLASAFALTFVIIKSTGVLTIEQIEAWLIQVKEQPPLYMGLIISSLLFLDLFIAVPTLTIIILSGYFLGFEKAIIFSLLGIYSAGIIGYILSFFYGHKVLDFVIKDKNQKKEAIKLFNTHGFVMILLSRAMPIIPEVSACLSGMTKLKFKKFILAWSISSIPYVLVASYAGSISSLENPKPAIFTAIGLSIFFWTLWFFYHKQYKKKR